MTSQGGRPTLAVVGATGAVGTVMCELLSSRANVWGEIRLVASHRSAGRADRGPGRAAHRAGARSRLSSTASMWRCSTYPTTWPRSGRRSPPRAGAVVVDNSGAFRMDPDVPLVVPEINADQVRLVHVGIIANPNCTTLSMIVAVGALHREYGLRELVVSSYQAASGAGQSGVDTLLAQVAMAAGRPYPGLAGRQPAPRRR